MAGHSRWANVKHRKAREDARRGKVFTKLLREVMVATRMGGGDPAGNPRLRTAIEKARGENVPGENIERAIKKGTGEMEGVHYEEYFYEGYGPGGVAVLVAVMTDNRNRTVSDVRHVFSKCGGRLGESGSVAWMFEKKGMFTFDMTTINEDSLVEVALVAGAEDVVTNEEDKLYEVYTSPADFHTVKETFDRKGFKYSLAEISMVPKTTVRVEGGVAQQVLRLTEELEELDDVQEVFANFDIPAQEMEKVA
ncbi:MAG: YebC/PmpR family DNA-binding transcriptional regulator [Deltaproteobacteria bacterium]|nr:YebC/PmpR family DNA-binding transcriptional regulator [Deltaproteobacteria bacterium]